MPSLPQVHALGANKTGLPGLILSYASCRGLWLPQHSATWADLSPYGNNGTATDVTYSGTAPFARMPIVPGSFNGSSSRVSITDATSLQFTSAMTAVIWYTGDPALNTTIFGRADTGAGKRSWRMGRETATGKFFVYLSADGGTTNVKSYIADASSYNTGWHQYAFTFSSGTFKLYFDGAESAVTKFNDGTVSSLYAAGSVPVQIGCSNTNGTPFLFAAGYYGIAAVFNAALTSADIQAMYLVGVNGP